MGVSLNGGTPKPSILIGVFIINHPFWGTTILGNPHIYNTLNPMGYDFNVKVSGVSSVRVEIFHLD